MGIDILEFSTCDGNESCGALSHLDQSVEQSVVSHPSVVSKPFSFGKAYSVVKDDLIADLWWMDETLPSYLPWEERSAS